MLRVNPLHSNPANFKLSLAFDDVLIKPGYSEVLPQHVNLKTFFSRRISMNIPLISSAMDTVTEYRTATVMAQEGGLGVIHKNLTIDEQCLEVEKVKKYVAGMIVDPITVRAHDPLTKVIELTRTFRISGVPVVDDSHRLIGILTNRDLRFETNFSQQVKDVMTSKNLITTKVGTTLDQAKELLQKYRIEKLPVVDEQGILKGLITVKDIEKTMTYPQANKDSIGRLRVAAAIGVGEKEYERAERLVQKQVDALVVDTAHGHSAAVLEMVRALKERFPQVDVVGGNVATSEGCAALIKAGADAVKIGCGPGSICTTRVIAGIGVPQMSAIFDSREICHEAGVPYIADGGIKYSGDIVKALAGGASSVMIGSLFAGTDEAPGETVVFQGRPYKVYRGMGSLGAMMLGSKDRYAQGHVNDLNKLVPEGVEGQVPYRGSLSMNIFQLKGGISSGMGYIGAKDIEELQTKAEFVHITNAGLKESHPHDITITKEPTNYHSFNK